MFRSILISAMFVVFGSNVALADLGFDRIIINNTGRCWKIINRDFDDKTRAVSAVSISVTNVTGTGQTDDVVTFDLMFKEDFEDGVGWDETKTRQYSGSGVITTIGNGRVRFELLVDPGNGDPLIPVDGYYHPGAGTSDADDRIILNIHALLSGSTEDDCDVIQVEEGGIL